MSFSIIIPVYNSQKFLQDCIDSVLCQTYHDYEIILIDDGSNDNSGMICDEYCARYSNRVTVHHTGNQGALAARRAGICASSGEILVFLDSDDCLRCDALELLHNAFASSESDLIIFNGSVRDDYSIPFRSYPFADGTVFSGKNREAVYRALVSSSILNNVCLKAAKRSVFDFDMDYSNMQRIRHGEDLLMSAQMLSSAQRILILNQNLYFYRQNEDSVVHTSQLGRADSVKAVHIYLQKLVKAWNMPWLITLHHTREVQGWIESLNLLKQELASDEYLSVIRQMAEDPYFRNAYENMDASTLSWKYRFLSNLLFRSKYRLYCTIVGLFSRSK